MPVATHFSVPSLPVFDDLLARGGVYGCGDVAFRFVIFGGIVDETI
jgi:hypothetical protein